MLNFLVSLIIACQLINPLQAIVMGVEVNQSVAPHRRVNYSFAPLINAPSVLVLDVRSGKILFQKNGFVQRPMASITKLMTAVVFLKQQPAWETYIPITDNDKLNGGRILLTPGMKIKIRDLFQATLIGSLNNGATALARASGLSQTDFINEMNQQAVEWGMSKTHFVEASGVDARNQSTAMEIAKLLKAVMAYKEIRQALGTLSNVFYTQAGERLKVYNTNELLKSYLDEVGGKTGYTDEAGYCLANLVKSQQAPQGIVVVVLGAQSKIDRFQESKFLSQWVFDNWQWQKE